MASQKGIKCDKRMCSGIIVMCEGWNGKELDVDINIGDGGRPKGRYMQKKGATKGPIVKCEKWTNRWFDDMTEDLTDDMTDCMPQSCDVKKIKNYVSNLNFSASSGLFNYSY